MTGVQTCALPIFNNETASSSIDELNAYIYEIYSITPIEAKIIRDTLDFDLSIFQKGTNSISFKEVNKDVLDQYVRTLLGRINQILSSSGKYMNAQIYYSQDCPLELIVLSVDDEEREVKIIENNDPIDAKLRQISGSLSGKSAQ